MKSSILKIGAFSLCIFAFNQVNGQSNQKSERTPEQVFTKVDSNSDNAIDKMEYTSMVNKRSEGKIDQKKTEQRFTKMDMNSDGLISKEEFVFMQKNRKQRSTENKN